MELAGQPFAIAVVAALVCWLIKKWMNARGKYLSDLQQLLVDFLVVFVSGMLVVYTWKKWYGGYAMESTVLSALSV